MALTVQRWKGVLVQADIKEDIIKKISTPAERTLTWGMSTARYSLRQSASRPASEFWDENRAECCTESAGETGVPIEMLVGIIGVETYYGRITGNSPGALMRLRRWPFATRRALSFSARSS